MIRVLASSNHEARLHAMRHDLRVVAAIHAAGRCLMGRLHKVEFSIPLPAIRQNKPALDISKNAGAFVNPHALTRDSALDICFGGYCAQLAFYDEDIPYVNNADIWVNTDWATNDFISLIRYLELHPVAPGELERQLNSGGIAAKGVVQALFRQHGKAPYKLMRTHRDQLIEIAQEIFDYWSARQFEECVWPGKKP